MKSKNTVKCVVMTVSLLIIAAIAWSPQVSAQGSNRSYDQVVADFQKVVAAGKKEGEVTIYGSVSRQVLEVVAKAMKDDYGITVNMVALGGPAMIARLQAENSSGVYEGDIAARGLSYMWDMKRLGLLKQIYPQKVLPALNDPTAKWNAPPIIDPEGYFVVGYRISIAGMIINTNLVPSEKEPKKWSDLTDPFWKNKIIMRNPTMQAGGDWSIIMKDLYGYDYIRAVAEQKPTVGMVGGEEQVKLVARGEHAINFPAQFEDIFKLPKEAPYKAIYPEDGTMSSMSGMVIAKNARHPNAALVLLNFLYSKEGGVLMAKAGNLHGRGDVPIVFPYQDMSRVKKVVTYTEEGFKAKSEVFKRIKPWFGLQ